MLQRVAQELTEDEIKSGAVYPDLNRIREISEKVAVDVSKYLFDAELATYRPEPHDHAAWVASKVSFFFTFYGSLNNILDVAP